MLLNLRKATAKDVINLDSKRSELSFGTATSTLLNGTHLDPLQFTHTQASTLSAV
jgi:hypothetical protein